MGKLFGTDGVRGEANSFLTSDLAFKLGKAAAYVLKGTEHKNKGILIGKDTRISGDMLEASLAAGICSMGVDVYILGVCPTPAVAYLTKNLDYISGVMISASHNPAIDNGIKFFDSNGYKLPDQTEEVIENFVFEGNIGEIPGVKGDKTGRIYDGKELLSKYKNFLLEEFPLNTKDLKIIVDCANGSASEMMPEILKINGCKFKAINSTPNGVNINLNCGSTHLESLKEEVIKEKADVGIAHDGDSDRVLFVDHNGMEIDGDMIMAIVSRDLKKKGLLKNNLVVGTVMSNLGLKKFLNQEEINFIEAKVGDRYVLEEMKKMDGSFGGEQSGHLIFLDHNTTGDGILTALIFLRLIAETGKSTEELFKDYIKYPQVLENAKVLKKDGWEQNPVIKESILNYQQKLGNDGRILVRASGTENLIRVMVEGSDQSEINKIALDLKNIILGELS
jgi:phosphoglucosamine mutase